MLKEKEISNTDRYCLEARYEVEPSWFCATSAEQMNCALKVQP